MQLTTSVLLFAIGASAAATPHRIHKRLHEKRAVGDVVTAVIDGKEVSWVNEYDGGATAAAQPTGAAPSVVANVAATPAPAAASTPAPAASKSSSSASDSKTASTFKPFCGGKKAKRATEANIFYKGNIGIDGDYGCNLQLVDASIADQYDNIMKFTSPSEDQNCACWNKIGPTGDLSGAFGHNALTFPLAAGTEKIVAADSDSQGACACYPGDMPKDSNGANAATWIEFDLDSTVNNHWSGGDISALIPQAANMPVQGMSVCTEDGSQCSSLGPNASNTKLAYVKGMEAADGVGLNLPPGKVRLNVIAGYSG